MKKLFGGSKNEDASGGGDGDAAQSARSNKGGKSGRGGEENQSTSNGSISPSHRNNSTSASMSVSKTDGRPRFGLFENGRSGRCRDCGLLRKSCNCHHCRVCGVYMLTLRTRHHCRMCWRAICPVCSEHYRVNDYYTGELTRTCDICAAPRGLLYLTDLLDHYTREEGEDGGAVGSAAGKAEPEEGPSFFWGLYALRCAMDAPRLCINPTCPLQFSYSPSCRKCGVPTVSAAEHEPRSVRMPANSKDKVKAILEEAEVWARQRREAEMLNMDGTTLNDFFAAVLPNRCDTHAFYGTENDPWTAQKILMASAACSIASEAQGSPYISLALSDVPYARLLQLEQAESTFSVLRGANNVRFVCFPSINSEDAWTTGAFLPPTQMEVWSTGVGVGGGGGDGNIGVWVRGEAEARRKGGVQRQATFRVHDGVLGEVDTVTIVELIRRIVNMASHGEEIVLCGHSMGGGAAAVLAMRTLIEHTAVVRNKLICVTFGAPLVAGRGLTELLDRYQLRDRFYNFVYNSDVVPRLSLLEQFLKTGPVAFGGEGGGELAGTSTVEVRDALVKWYAARLLPCTEPVPQDPAKRNAAVEMIMTWRQGKLSSSPKKIERPTNVAEALGVSEKQTEGTSGSTATTSPSANVTTPTSVIAESGDVFALDREPFTNDLRAPAFISAVRAPKVEMGELTRRLMGKRAAEVEEAADFTEDTEMRVLFATESYRQRQLLEPYGSYHFLFNSSSDYTCSNEPTEVLGLLADRKGRRVLLRDHLISSYNKALTEYMHTLQ